MSEQTPALVVKRMIAIREQRRALAEQDKELVGEWRDLEAQLIALGDDQGINRLSTADGTATITEETVPNAVDWDAIYQYIADNDAFHLLQRRVSTAAFRELLDAGVQVPGIDPYNNRKVLLRKAK